MVTRNHPACPEGGETLDEASCEHNESIRG